jgi:hypothetical protein
MATLGLGELAVKHRRYGLLALGVTTTLLAAGHAQAAPELHGAASRSGFSVGSCQVASMDVKYHFQVMFNPQAGATIDYWEPAGADCEFNADLMLQVEHAGATKWIRLTDTVKRPPRVHTPTNAQEGVITLEWDTLLCDSDGSDCLSDKETHQWWKDGFHVVSFDFWNVSSSGPVAPAAPEPAKPSPKQADWAPKVEWHPSPLPPTRSETPPREKPEQPPPQQRNPEPEPEPEARTIKVQPLPEIKTYEETAAGQPNPWQTALKDSLANHKSDGPSIQFKGTAAWGASVGVSPIGWRSVARMDSLLLPLYIGLGLGASDVDGRMTYVGDNSQLVETNAAWGPLMTGGIGLSVLPPLCKWVDGVKNCSGAALAFEAEFLYHSGNVEQKTINENFVSYGPELVAQIALLKHLAVTSHFSYRWFTGRPAVRDDFAASGVFFDLGLAYLDRGKAGE